MSDEKKLKGSDEFTTPLDVLQTASAMAPIVWDLACTRENNVVGRLFGAPSEGYTKSDDALKQDWAKLFAENNKPNVALFLNPPFSKPNLDRFGEKTKEEVCRGANIHFVGPANTASLWFHHLFFAGCDVIGKEHVPRGPVRGTLLHLDHSYYTAKIYLIEYRLSFGHPDMKEAEQANKGHVYAFFKSKRRYTPKLRAAASLPADLATEGSEQPAPPPPDPSPEGQ